MKSVASLKPVTVLLVLASIALAIPFLASLAQTTVTGQAVPSPSPKPKLSDIRKNFPSVEYASEENKESSRRERGKKYDKYKNLNPDITKDVEEVSFADWLRSNDPLPTTESQLIALGIVVDARAHLSEKKYSVYSEFKIELKKIFKSDLEASVADRKYLTAERDGGIVIFPNGFKNWFFVSGQGMPVVGGEYLFFLTSDFPLYGHHKKDLFLLTAFRLRNGIVEPLDNPGGGTHPMSKYNGKAEIVLLSDLETALGK